MSRTLPIGVELAAACCAWPPSAEADARVRHAAGQITDWAHFALVAKLHQIDPLVHRALVRAGVALPEAIKRELAERERAVGQRSLVLARETRRLQEAFDQAGVPAVMLKGTALGLLAYGELGLTRSLDIDILTLPETAIAARQLLIREGYDKSFAYLSANQFERYVSYGKEASFFNSRGGLAIDLHWRLADNSGTLPGIHARSPVQAVPVARGSIRTLADEALFAHLCVHAAAHNAGRLKWLADINAFVARRSAPEVEQLYEASRAYRAQRSAGVILRLCHRLFALPLSEGLKAKLDKDPLGGWLEANALAALACGGGAADAEHETAGWLRMMAAQFLLVPGPAHFATQAWTLWNAGYDRVQISLPRGLGFLHHVLRLPLWGARLGARLLAGRSSQSGSPVPRDL